MSWYKNNKSEWKEIIDTISLDLKRNHLMVEKSEVVGTCHYYKSSNVLIVLLLFS